MTQKTPFQLTWLATSPLICRSTSGGSRTKSTNAAPDASATGATSQSSATRRPRAARTRHAAATSEPSTRHAMLVCAISATVSRFTNRSSMYGTYDTDLHL